MIVTNRKEFEEALRTFTPRLTVDLETSGLSLWKKARLCGVGICTSTYLTYYFPFRHRERTVELSKGVPVKGIEGPLAEGNLPIEWLPELLDKISEADVLIGQNLKFDLAGMYQDGMRLRPHTQLHDTASAARLRIHDKFAKLNLETLAKVILRENPDNWKTGIVTHLKNVRVYPRYDYGDISTVGKYCETDCETTFKIHERLEDHIKRTGQEAIWQQEVDLLRVLFEDMEVPGMYFDREYCLKKIPLLQKRINKLSSEIFDRFGYEFEINSTHQLKKAFNSIGISSHLQTEKGNEKWNLEVLLSIEDPVAKKVLQYRESYKMLNTYMIPYSEWEDGYLHPSFLPWGAATGRMSCKDPNLQNVMTKPIDTGQEEKIDEKVQELMKSMASSQSVSSRWIARITKFEETDTTVAVKRLFVAPEGYHLYMADVSQMEMRVFSDYMNDPHILEMLESDEFDFHSFVATEVWGAKETDDTWKFYRSVAKAINFGMIYGIGVNKLASQISKTVKEASEYKDSYFERFPLARDFMNRVKLKIQKVGVIYNRFNRRYEIRSDKAYTGVNYLCQGTSADYIKNRMIALSRFFKENKYQSRMVCQIHDELLFYIHEDEVHILPKIKEIMEERTNMKVLLPVEISKGNPSWSEKISICGKCWKEASECECKSK